MTTGTTEAVAERKVTGIRQGMTRAEYEAIHGLNQSTLKLFRRTPAHAREYMVHPPEPTDALELGTAVHVAVLEPERFARQYVAAPKVDRRTKAGKEQWAAFEDAHRGLEVLSAEDMEVCRGIADAAVGLETVARLLASPGKSEVGVVWDDPQTGVRCKALMDRITTFAGWTVVVDLKSTQDASPGAFARDCAKYAYHVQAAFYLDGLNVLAPANRRFFHVAVEKARPYCCAVYELDPPAVAQGRADYREYLRVYAECARSGRWPGYRDAVEPLSLPVWALSEEVLNGTH